MQVERCSLSAREAAPAASEGIEIPSDGGGFERLCTKLATGTGKTVVMAMLIAWQVLNKVADSQNARYSKQILIVAPGLTVRNRLVYRPTVREHAAIADQRLRLR